MARITVEDCLQYVDNRFQLVLVAATRTRQLLSGAEPCVERGNDKLTVVALREIAGGFVTSAILDDRTPPEGYESDEDTTNQIGASGAEAPAAPGEEAAGGA